MKITFKNILVIFLVALLGGACGSYGFSLLHNETSGPKLVVEEVNYSDHQLGIYEEVIKKAIKSVVEISSESVVTSNTFFGPYTSKETSLGSGVIISEDGYIVTNNHVVEGSKEVQVSLNNGEVKTGTVIGTDTNTDLALIKIEASGLTYSKIVDSDQLRMGQEVIAIGNSLGKGLSSTNGIISALDREIVIDNYTMTLIVTNAAINSGNSGGGLFDMNGNLVGIVNAKTLYSSSQTAVEGTGYAIPANTVLSVINDIKSFGYVKSRPTLGVRIYTNNSSIGYSGEGVVVSDVIDGMPAQKAGVLAGDIILAIDGHKVNSFSQLDKVLQGHLVGDEIELEILRKEETLMIKVVLSENIKD